MKSHRTLWSLLLLAALTAPLYASKEDVFSVLFNIRKFDAKSGRVVVEAVMPVELEGIADSTYEITKGAAVICQVQTEARGEIKSMTGEPVEAAGIVLSCEHGFKVELRKLLFTPVSK